MYLWREKLISKYCERGSEWHEQKEIIVSNVSEEHNNPIAELVQVACRFDS